MYVYIYIYNTSFAHAAVAAGCAQPPARGQEEARREPLPLRPESSTEARPQLCRRRAASLPSKIIPTKIPWLNLSGKFPVDMRIPPLKLRLCLSQTLWNPES